ncbi:PREDICTED: putative disease resistance [Prunus dulcis]|uniref:PREDICTED: putative disease resistance n=1 Tax=Prunus dulcis TaxID=3755 RepID=A0A5E4F2E1_PRUDU|nr:PREDICTED: putative disease resistance [Prunus dulcis]
MEKASKRLLDELLSRSLFQPSGKSSFTMHDLIIDLAMFMSKGFSYRLEVRESHEIERVRHLSYAREEFDVAHKFDPLKGAKCLRTFLPTSLNPYEKCYLSKQVLQVLLPSLRCLRVLSLSRYKNVNVLPDSIENLIHLRYLDLSYTALERLPDVLCGLYNLQTLLLSHCSSLVELPTNMRKLINLQKLMLTGCKSLTKLPVDMRKLINLHHLDVSGTKIVEMPVQMGRLKSLRTLAAFVDALQGNLKDKKDLKGFVLEWSDEDADDSLKEKDVLDNLQPCVNLEKLTIRSYGGTQFPNWLRDSSFFNIQVLRLKDCSYCWLMPPIGQLPALKKLRIKRMKLVKTIGVEFYGRNEDSPIQPFQSLEKLQFGEMAEWEEWVPSGSGSGGEYGPDFPRLQELFLKDCPKLRGSLLLACHLPCLKKLWVST